MKEDPLVTGEHYHVFNKSIEGFRIFNKEQEFVRMLHLIRYYRWQEIMVSFSRFTQLRPVTEMSFNQERFFDVKRSGKRVNVIAFCLMPTHIHLLVKQLKDGGISKFMSDLLNSYARYFNVKYQRKGPLWVGRFKRVLVKTDEQLWHLSRYVHLNPTTAGLVKRPQDWAYSSYREYLNMVPEREKISNPHDVYDVNPTAYKKFVDSQIDYQKELGRIKSLLLE